MANNIRKLNTQGIEVHSNYMFTMNNLPQKFTLGYTFIEDDIKDINATFSRYSINSAKHQLTNQLATQFIKNLSQTVTFRYIERTAGQSYGIIDANISYVMDAFELSILANNIFNKDYSEQNLIPMPKGNMLFGLKYNFK